MFKPIFVIVLFTQMLAFSLIAQTDTAHKNKGRLYILWGYNREKYTKSTIHFKNNGNPNLHNQFGVYDFSIYNAIAHDKSDFDQLYDVINITIPQFNARIGYYFSDERNVGIELNYDHAKYVVTDGQKLHIKGNILGQYVDKDTVLMRDNFHFEHTDGANFFMLNGLKRWDLMNSTHNKYKLNFIVKTGAGVVIPRTDVTIFRERVNNNWKVAGTIIGAESGLRAELWKHWVLELTAKATWAWYINCLVQGKGHGSARHNFGALQGIFAFGYQI